ncbi:universal stress protein [Streptomyces sp. AK02-01A]|uniref:universal stress protein n=1 Tax=Streptomyces sp. AK02-01A TaxID=3028648 RepID=UPI0029A048E3|nr:universal stress protein [Streptomyces sp. AK02-01A]MDX3851841.1 universal stress protein [Streptomyces sp. AK02-01A]
MDDTAPGRQALGQALGPVVTGTDGSDHATRAVLWAADEAAVRGRPLTIVHALGVEQALYLAYDDAHTILDRARTVLDEATAQVSARRPDVRVSATVSYDETTESLLEAAGTDGTIVLGSRGLGGFSALLVGSAGLRTAAHARGPVIVVRDVTDTSEHRVVAALRDERDQDALRFAARTAALRDVPLRVVSVWMFLRNAGSMATMVDDLSGVARSEAEATAHLVVPIRKEFPDLTVTEDTVRAVSVAGALVEAAEHADLLVTGARGPTHPISSPLGRVTHAVIHRARCPVAIVPRG